MAARFWLVVDESDLCFEVNRETIDLAMSSISWLHAPSMSPVAPKRHRELTARQRMVLTMLLDGRSRKQIASNLGITEETVGDHLKSIYRQYQVKSASDSSGVVPAGESAAALESGSEDRNLTKHPRIRGWRGSAPRKHIQT